VKQALGLWGPAVLGIFVIGSVDYVTGSEIRIFPLYYAPITYVAWHRGRSGALVAAALCALAWLGSNSLAGMQFSRPGIWFVNTLVQGLSFAIVGLLIATLRVGLIRERRLSRTDSLTMLSNSRGFYEDAGRILERCRLTGHPITMAYMDLDNFKAVNDTLGHEVGDDVIRRAGEHLRQATRPGDLSARLGGDEFALLLHGIGPGEIAAILERLRSSFQNSITTSTAPVTVSVGGVTFTTAPDSVEQMVQRADSKMYQAKATGRNRVELEVVDTVGH
jgi:diguanylate cyclase (GGDEF)-like protein